MSFEKDITIFKLTIQNFSYINTSCFLFHRDNVKKLLIEDARMILIYDHTNEFKMEDIYL